MLFSDFIHCKPFGLQAIVGTENASFLFCKCLAYHREYLAKQLATLYLGVGKAFASLVLYVVERPVILPLISESSIGVFFVKQFLI